MQTTTLTLQGDGYQLGITPDAEALKARLLEGSSGIAIIADPQACDAARAFLKQLAGFRLDLERSRKAVKEPVLQIGRDIDTRAAEFGGTVLAEEKRIEKLVADFAAEQERQRREAEEHARKAAAEADRLQREKAQAELDRQRAELEADRLRLEQEKQKVAEVAAPTVGGFLARKRAQEAAAAEAARVEAERSTAEQREVELGEQIAEVVEQASDAALASTVPTVAGVKPELDFEVTDLAALYRHAPHLVQLVPVRKAILAALKAIQATGAPVVVPGLQIKEVFKVSKR